MTFKCYSFYWGCIETLCPGLQVDRTLNLNPYRKVCPRSRLVRLRSAEEKNLLGALRDDANAEVPEMNSRKESSCSPAVGAGAMGRGENKSPRAFSAALGSPREQTLCTCASACVARFISAFGSCTGRERETHTAVRQLTSKNILKPHSLCSIQVLEITTNNRKASFSASVFAQAR